MLESLAFHHLGLATRDPEASIAFVRALGYRPSPAVLDAVQNVNLIWCEHDSSPTVEIIYPTDTAGPLDKILAHRSEQIYHVCYETPDLDATLDAFDAHGLRLHCVSPPKPAVLFGMRPVSFYSARGFGLIELLER